MTNILSDLDYDEGKENQCTKNLTSEFNEILDNSVTINLNQLDVQPQKTKVRKPKNSIL